MTDHLSLFLVQTPGAEQLADIGYERGHITDEEYGVDDAQPPFSRN